MHVVGYGAPASESERSALRSELSDIVTRLRFHAHVIKMKSESRGLLSTILGAVFPPILGLEIAWTIWGPEVKGWDSMFAIIDAKERSIDEVVAGTLTVERWAQGVEVFRRELAAFAEYVEGATDARTALAALGADIVRTVKQYTQITVIGLGVGAFIALGVLILVKR